MKIFSEIKHFLKLQFYTLYYFYELVNRYKVRYDRTRFPRFNQSLGRYCLVMYRELFDGLGTGNLDYPLYITKNAFSIRYPTAHMFAMIIRCSLVLFVPPLTATRDRRIAIGTEMFKEDRNFLDTTLLLWSNIAFACLVFSVTTSLLDYKFLALFKMSGDIGEKCWKPEKFGLTTADFKRFSRFRGQCSVLYVVIMATVFPCASLCIIFLFSRASLYETNLLSSLAWATFICVWIFYVCASIYGNLVVFLIVARYIQIKQQSISRSLYSSFIKLQVNFNTNHRLTSLWLQWHRFLVQNIRYSYLQDELVDYNRFCGSYLSAVFINYVLLICCFIYIVFLSHTAVYFQAVYAWVGVVHVVLLISIIYYCDAIVSRNNQLAVAFTCLLAHFEYSYSHISPYHLIKMHNITHYFTLTPSGFTLLNGHIINNNTLKIIIVNIAIYFLLIIKP